MSLLAIDTLNVDDPRLTGFTTSLAMRSEHIMHLTCINAMIIPWNNKAARDADRLGSIDVAKQRTPFVHDDPGRQCWPTNVCL
ncbi:hypothetical protein [Rhodanobacter sp. C01]|uniref:hypothetical protein n=1 Tax=Rhodanobacter sp. C01 TaxID=1945856 RepID=UPI000985183C|nr:hypothetical protein [Rhodanobacter sp. C01]OOG50905.1 hypothetical protein B0E50_01545 [Rhodanobacter sp. C01]